MFFRMALFVALTLGLSACDLYMNAKPPQASLKIGGMNCLSQIGPTVSAYVDDELSETEINEFFSCMQKAFVLFEGNTRGSKQDEYTPNEIRNFLQKYFIKDRKISDELLGEFMLVKTTLVGGTVDVIKRKDLHEAAAILETLKKEAIHLKPYIRLLNNQLIDKEPRENLRERIQVAQQKMHESIEVIVPLFANAQQPYSIQNFENLLNELREFVNWDNHFSSPRPISQWMGLLRNFKDVTVSKTEQIAPQEWGPLLKASANWYTLFLEIKISWDLKNFWEEDHLAKLHGIVQKAMRYVRDAIGRQAGARTQARVIEFERLSALYESVEKMGWTSPQWPKIAVDQVFRAFITKILGEEFLPPETRRAKGIGLIHLDRLQKEVAQWYDYQGQIEASQLLNHQSFPLRQFYYPDISGILLIEDFDKNEKIDRFNLTVYNALRSLSNLAIKGYAVQPRLGLSRQELQNLYLDIRDLMIAWHLADPREYKTGMRAYLEGNLFTYAANGNDHLESAELIQLMAFLKTGGQLGNVLYDSMLPYCMDATLDVHGKNSLLRGCVQRFLSDHLGTMTQNMPGFKKFFNDLDRTARMEYVGDLLEAVYTRHSVPEVVESGDVLSLAAVLQYEEAVFTRYNHNRDLELAGAELDEAFHTFRWLLKNMAEATCQPLSDSRVRLAFDYILRYQEIPESDLKTWWRFQWDSDPIHLDRMHLNKVFKTLIRKIIDNGSAPKICK